jgi:hypothetical protein
MRRGKMVAVAGAGAARRSVPLRSVPADPQPDAGNPCPATCRWWFGRNQQAAVELPLAQPC